MTIKERIIKISRSQILDMTMYILGFIVVVHLRFHLSINKILLIFLAIYMIFALTLYEIRNTNIELLKKK